PAIRGHVVFEKVFFRYDTTPPESWILKNINLEAKPGETVAPVAPTRATVSPGLASRLIFFTTPPESWILKNINLEAKPGETVALVGATGSGKTSIISLLARFYEPQQGRVLIDGLDLQSATIQSLHEQIGLVTQENFLFTGSVMENLKFGRPGASDEEVIEAAQSLGTHEIILRLADGYQT